MAARILRTTRRGCSGRGDLINRWLKRALRWFAAPHPDETCAGTRNGKRCGDPVAPYPLPNSKPFTHRTRWLCEDCWNGGRYFQDANERWSDSWGRNEYRAHLERETERW